MFYEAMICAADKFFSRKQNKEYTKLYVVLNRGIAEVICEGDQVSLSGTVQPFAVNGNADGSIRLRLALDDKNN